jgi:lysophospholipase L1-like esterase
MKHFIPKTTAAGTCHLSLNSDVHFTAEGNPHLAEKVAESVSARLIGCLKI